MTTTILPPWTEDKASQEKSKGTTKGIAGIMTITLEIIKTVTALVWTTKI